jgi:hypothetical protein
VPHSVPASETEARRCAQHLTASASFVLLAAPSVTIGRLQRRGTSLMLRSVTRERERDERKSTRTVRAIELTVLLVTILGTIYTVLEYRSHEP